MHGRRAANAQFFTSIQPSQPAVQYYWGRPMSGELADGLSKRATEQRFSLPYSTPDSHSAASSITTLHRVVRFYILRRPALIRDLLQS